MPFSRLRTKVPLWGAALLFSLAVFASASKDEGAEGGAPAETSKDQREFNEKTAKLNSLSNRIEEAEKRFHELVREKAETGSQEHKQAIIKEMVEIAAKRNADVASYNKIRTELNYRYPYQGEALNRRYQTQSERSPGELENAGGLDELLTRTKRLIDRKYAPFMPEEKEKPKVEVARPVEEKPKRLRLEK